MIGSPGRRSSLTKSTDPHDPQNVEVRWKSGSLDEYDSAREDPDENDSAGSSSFQLPWIDKVRILFADGGAEWRRQQHGSSDGVAAGEMYVLRTHIPYILDAGMVSQWIRSCVADHGSSCPRANDPLRRSVPKTPSSLVRRRRPGLSRRSADNTRVMPL